MSSRTRTFLVEGMSSGHRRASVSEEVTEVEGVEVDLANGRLDVRGESIRDEDIEAAVEEAGYSLAGGR